MWARMVLRLCMPCHWLPTSSGWSPPAARRRLGYAPCEDKWLREWIYGWMDISSMCIKTERERKYWFYMFCLAAQNKTNAHTSHCLDSVRKHVFLSFFQRHTNHVSPYNRLIHHHLYLKWMSVDIPKVSGHHDLHLDVIHKTPGVHLLILEGWLGRFPGWELLSVHLKDNYFTRALDEMCHSLEPLRVASYFLHERIVCFFPVCIRHRALVYQIDSAELGGKMYLLSALFNFFVRLIFGLANYHTNIFVTEFIASAQILFEYHHSLSTDETNTLCPALNIKMSTAD